MKEKRSRGRPSKFNQIDLEQVRKLAEQGLTDKQMSYVLGINEDTFNEYKKKSEFSEPLKAGKAIADARVERALFERATGYSHPEIKFFAHEGMVMDEREVIKHYPPDTTACIFWLKNRKRGEWRDTQDHTHSIPDGVEVKVIERLKKLSPEERAKRIRELKTKNAQRG